MIGHMSLLKAIKYEATNRLIAKVEQKYPRSVPYRGIRGLAYEVATEFNHDTDGAIKQKWILDYLLTRIEELWTTHEDKSVIAVERPR